MGESRRQLREARGRGSPCPPAQAQPQAGLACADGSEHRSPPAGGAGPRAWNLPGLHWVQAQAARVHVLKFPESDTWDQHLPLNTCPTSLQGLIFPEISMIADRTTHKILVMPRVAQLPQEAFCPPGQRPALVPGHSRLPVWFNTPTPCPFVLAGVSSTEPLSSPGFPT